VNNPELFSSTEQGNISSILLRSSEIRWISKKNNATFSRNLLQTTYNEAIAIDNSQHKIWCSPEGKLLVK